jgi:hypothetical protein
MNDEENADPQQQRTHQHTPASFVIRDENPPLASMFPGVYVPSNVSIRPDW